MNYNIKKKVFISAIACSLAFGYSNKLDAQSNSIIRKNLKLEQSKRYAIGIYDTFNRGDIDFALFSNNKMLISNLMNDWDYTMNPKEKSEFLELLSKLNISSFDKKGEINKYIYQNPATIESSRLALYMALVSMSNKETAEMQFYLDKVNSPSLEKNELSLYNIILAINIFNSDKDAYQKGSNPNKAVNALLEKALYVDSDYSEDALLLLSILKYSEKDRLRAYDIISKHNWSKKLKSLAEYYEAIMNFDTLGNDKLDYSINKANEFIEKDEAIKDKSELLKALALAYFKKDDYQNTIKFYDIVTADKNHKKDDLLDFVYLASLYKSSKYKDVVEKVKSSGIPKLERLKELALEILAFSQIETGNTIEAVSTFSNIINSLDDFSTDKHRAMYNSVVLQNSMGLSYFSQASKLAVRHLNITDRKKTELSLLLSEALYDSKDYQESLKIINSINKPNSAIKATKQYVLHKSAEILDSKLDKNQIIKISDEALSLGNISPYYKENLLLRAKTYLDNEDYLESEKYSRLAIKEDGSNIWHNGIAKYILAYSLYNQNRYAEAINAFDNFLSENSVIDNRYKSDALLRMGDIYYYLATKSSANAGESYEKAQNYYINADKILENGNDEALMKLSNIYYVRANFDKQISTIDKVIDRNKDANILAELLYKKAKAISLSSSQNDNEAFRLYDNIIEKYSDSHFARLSYLEKAMLKSAANEKDEAIEIYKDLINKYKNTEEALQAIEDLRSIYRSKNDMETYIAYRNSLGDSFSINKLDEANLLFDEIEELYVNKSPKAEKSLEAYISKYPGLSYTNKAKIYLANIKYNSGKLDDAYKLYSELDKENTSDDIHYIALSRLADIDYSATRYKEAAIRYEKLISKSNSIDKDKLAKMQISMLRAYYYAGENQKLIEKSNNINRNSFQEKELLEFDLLRAKALYNTKKLKESLIILSQVNKIDGTSLSSEAEVLHAQVLLDLGKKKEAKDRVINFIRNSSSDQYWMARAFILLSDISLANGDKFSAEQYLESLSANYQGDSKEIKDMIEIRLKKLKK